MATSTKKLLTIRQNNMLIVKNQTTGKIEVVVGLSDKIIRPMPDDEKNTILISSEYSGKNGLPIKFKEAFGGKAERFTEVDDLLDYLAPEIVTAK